MFFKIFKSRMITFGPAGFALLLFIVAFENCSPLFSELPIDQSSSRPILLSLSGGPVTIYGSGFNPNSVVMIDSRSCTNVQIISPRELTCNAPPYTGGPGIIVVDGVQLTMTISYKTFRSIRSVIGRDGQDGAVDGSGQLARLFQISGMAMVGRTMYLSDYKLNNLRKVDLSLDSSSGQPPYAVTTISGSASFFGGHSDGIGSAATFNSPGSLALLKGALYIADTDNCAIRKMDLATNNVTTLFDHTACDVVDGVGAAVRTGSVYSLTANQDFLFTDERAAGGGHVIRKIDVQTLTATTIAGGNTLTFPSDALHPYWTLPPNSTTGTMVLAVPIETSHPYTDDLEREIVAPTGAIAMRLHFTRFQIDTDDELRITDEQDYSQVLSLKGDQGLDFWTPYIAMGKINLNFSASVATTSYGFTIDKIEYVTGPVNFQAFTNSSDGPAASTPIAAAEAMVAVGQNLFFLDSDQNLVRKLDLTSLRITAVLGQGAYASGSTFWSLPLRNPSGLTSDGSFIYVADLSENRVLQVNPETRQIFSLVHSPSGANPANLDGPLGTAAISLPRNLLFDPLLGLFVDCFNVIRLISY